MQTVDVGEAVPILTAWWDEDRADAEPSAITLTITPPTGAVITKTKVDMTTPDVAPDVLSHWQYPLTITELGVWSITATGTVDGETVTQGFLFLAGGASLADGPCEPWTTWPEVEALCGLNTADQARLDALPNATREYLIDVASWVLYSLTGRRYLGICDTTRRVCLTCRTCGGYCHCGIIDTIDLSGGKWPVHAAFNVTIEGEVLDGSAYTVRSKRWLDRIDGNRWPTNSTLSDPSAFVVSFAFGRQPPTGLRHAAARYVAEMAKKCAGLKCAIPERLTSITREGVTYTIIDSQRFLDEGRTGLTDVDAMLAAEKAGRADVKPGGYSPMSDMAV